ncbi:MAG: hypothetical protein MUF34_33200, partial [Polyangiaceae bacterium]|nr:hypothetical protein [Polyangiaceae bacterium]
LKLCAALRADLDAGPSDELFLVTHRALRDVPRVRVLWNLLVERTAKGAAPFARKPGKPAGERRAL